MWLAVVALALVAHDCEALTQELSIVRYRARLSCRL